MGERIFGAVVVAASFIALAKMSWVHTGYLFQFAFGLMYAAALMFGFRHLLKGKP